MIATAVAAVAATAFCVPIFASFGNWGTLDWDQHLLYNDAPRRSIVEYREVPLWNPYYCGGMVNLANPQSPFLSPTFVFVLLFGAVKGLKLQIWFHLLFGMVGTYFLARRFRVDRVSAWLPAFVYMLSINPAPLAAGMTSLNLPVAFLPWAFLCFEKGFEKPRYSVVAAIFLALMLFGGGVYVLVMTGLFFVVYAAATGSHYGWRSALRNLIVVFTLATLLGAIKLVPSVEHLRTFPRDTTEFSGYTLESLAYSLFGRDHSFAGGAEFSPAIDPWRGITFGMDENGMYMGVVPFLLAVVGFMRARDPRRWALLQVAVIFLWISFGETVPASLWAALKKLPVIESMRIAQRYRNVFMLALALFAGMGLQVLLRRIRHRGRWRPLAGAVAVLVFVFVDIALVQGQLFGAAFPTTPIGVERGPDFYQVWQFDAAPGDMYPGFLANVGVIECYEPLRGPVNAIGRNQEGYRAEAFLVGTEGRAEIRDWSPNRVVVDVETIGTGRLVLNQNAYPGWKAVDERGMRRQVDPWEGLVSVDVSPDDGVVELRYLPTSFVAGSSVTLATLGLLLAWWLRGRRRWNSRAEAANESLET